MQDYGSQREGVMRIVTEKNKNAKAREPVRLRTSVNPYPHMFVFPHLSRQQHQGEACPFPSVRPNPILPKKPLAKSQRPRPSHLIMSASSCACPAAALLDDAKSCRRAVREAEGRWDSEEREPCHGSGPGPPDGCFRVTLSHG